MMSLPSLFLLFSSHRRPPIKNFKEDIFMDIERNNFASKGDGGAGLGLGIAGTALGLLNGNGLGGLLGGNTWNNGCCSDDHMVNRYEASQSARIAELETQKALLESSIYVDGKLNDFRNYVDNRFASVEHELCDQRVFNNTAINNISCISGQVAQLMGLTKLVVPNTSVCPGWGDVTVSVTPATTTTP
jgi:hypothetical protein